MTLDAAIDEILKRAGERVVDRLSSCINLSPDHAASIRRAASNISQTERDALYGAVGLAQRTAIVDVNVKRAGEGHCIVGVKTSGL